MKEEKEIRCFISDLKIEQRGEGTTESRTITGYAAKYGVWSQPMYSWFREIIECGAFDECDMSDVIMCFEHNRDNILARSSSGTLSIEIDETGIKFSFESPNTTLGNDMLELVSRGDISGCSFAFTVESDSWIYADSDNKLELDERTILKIKKIFDLALVVYPAYTDTEVSVRHLEERKQTFLQENKNNGSSSRERLCNLLHKKTNI